MPTIEQIERLNEENDGYFFNPKTMKFFSSRVSEKTHGYYFITSERDKHSAGAPRLYSVRHCDPETGHISTIKHMEYYTAREAHAEAERLHKTNPSNTDEL